MVLPVAMLGHTRGGMEGGKFVGALHLLTHRDINRLPTVEVLDTASWGVYYTWACEDGNRARQRGRTVILAPPKS